MLQVLLLLVAAARGSPPNSSLATLPVGYYGCSWPTKHAREIDFLSKMRFTILMQEDGECWKKCCPHQTGPNACQSRSLPGNGVPIYNASTFPGCDPSCDQHGTQDAVLARVRAAAAAAGRPAPHTVLYMNSVYDWPYDAAHAGGNAVDLLDVNGVPHAEQCDPGIYPSFFLDYSRPAGRAAFLHAVEKYILNGTADGVYLDNFDEVPLHCSTDNTSCIAHRNGRPDEASVVTHQQVVGYTRGKHQVLRQATQLVAAGTGGMFTAKTWNTNESHDPYGANTALIGRGAFTGSVQDLIDTVQQTLFGSGYRYGMVMHGLSPEALDPKLWPPPSRCSEYDLVSFLMAVPRPTEDHALFLQCCGWDDRFDRPLGNPLGPPQTGTDGIMRRSFEAGVNVTWNTTCAPWNSAHCKATSGGISWPGLPLGRAKPRSKAVGNTLA